MDYRIEQALNVVDALGSEFEKCRSMIPAVSFYNAVSLKYWSLRYKIYHIDGFQQEANELVQHMLAADSFIDKHNLLCDFNDLLECYRDRIAEIFDILHIYPDEEGKYIFSNCSYGGRV